MTMQAQTTPRAFTPEEFAAALGAWLAHAQQLVIERYATERYASYQKLVNIPATTYPTSPKAPLVGYDTGRRYLRVWTSDGSLGGRSAFAFIDKANGDVLKPDTWKGPAKGARGSIFTPDAYGAVTFR